MGKYDRKKAGKTNKGAVIALLVVLVILLAVSVLFVMTRVLNNPGDEGWGLSNGSETEFPEETYGDFTGEFTEESPDADSGVDNTEANTEFADAVVFPLVLENGKLEIENLIQYDGLNPDCGNQEGYDIAAVMVKNLSDTYLKSAEISMTSSNGSILTFVITDLPAGATVIAFSNENTAVETNMVFGDVICEAVFDAGANMADHLIDVSVDGTAITLQNRTNESLSNIVVYCHASLGDEYFGGITYTYTVQTLPANGSAAVEAVDCLLGLAEVVRVAINES